MQIIVQNGENSMLKRKQKAHLDGALYINNSID